MAEANACNRRTGGVKSFGGAGRSVSDPQTRVLRRPHRSSDQLCGVLGFFAPEPQLGFASVFNAQTTVQGTAILSNNTEIDPPTSTQYSQSDTAPPDLPVVPDPHPPAVNWRHRLRTSLGLRCRQPSVSFTVYNGRTHPSPSPSKIPHVGDTGQPQSRGSDSRGGKPYHPFPPQSPLR